MSIVCKEGLRGMSSDSMETASSKEGRGVCIGVTGKIECGNLSAIECPRIKFNIQIF